MDTSIMNFNKPMALARTVRIQAHTMPGLYPMFLYMNDGGVLCYNCVQDNFHEISTAVRDDDDISWFPAGMSSTAEIDEPLYCSHCYKDVAE